MNGVFPSLKSSSRHGTLKCPDCSIVMAPYACEEAVIDKCPQCSGIWFDHLEIGVFKKTLGQFDYSKFQSLHLQNENSHHISNCPRCRSEILHEVVYTYNAKVKTHKCEKCKGLWLPLKELVNLMEMSQLSQQMAPHLSGLVDEIKKNQKQSNYYSGIKNLGDTLNQRVHTHGTIFVPWNRWFLPFILPLYDNLPRNIFPLGTAALILLSFASYYTKTTQFLLPQNILTDFALIPDLLLNGGSWKPFFSHLFLHFGQLHLFFNMFFLWMFGDNVEESLGLHRFFVVFVFCAFASAGTHVALDPQSITPLLGTGGAISGLLGSYLVLHPQATVRTFIVTTITDVPAWMCVVIWFVAQIIFGYGSAAKSVAWAAHISGLIAGIAITYLLRYLRSLNHQ